MFTANSGTELDEEDAWPSFGWPRLGAANKNTEVGGDSERHIRRMVDLDSDQDNWPSFGHPKGMNKSVKGIPDSSAPKNLCKETENRYQAGYLHPVAIKNTPIKLLMSPVFRLVITYLR